MMTIEMDRVFGMANRATFKVPPIREFVERRVLNLPRSATTIDPFARESRYADITNDLNPDYGCDFCMDALDFLRQFDDESIDCVIYDPPYSPRQVAECYKGFGYEVTSETTRSSWKFRHMNEVARILKPGGYLLSFGWNSNGAGKKRGFEVTRIRLVHHGGGSAHDTICMEEVKRAQPVYIP